MNPYPGESDKVYKRPHTNNFTDEHGKFLFLTLDARAANYRYVGSLDDEHGELEVWKRVDLWIAWESDVVDAG